MRYKRPVNGQFSSKTTHLLMVKLMKTQNLMYRVHKSRQKSQVKLSASLVIDNKALTRRGLCFNCRFVDVCFEAGFSFFDAERDLFQFFFIFDYQTMSRNQEQDQSDDGSDLSAQECQELLDRFIAVTNTNEPLAMMFLQERDWKLEAAINDYLEQNHEAGSKASSNVVNLSSDSDEDSSPSTKKIKGDSTEESASVASVQSRKEFLFITWNIDGLDAKNLVLRTEAVCKIIEDIKADVVFLQEVVPESETIIRDKMSKNYMVLNAQTWNGFQAKYFVVTLVRKAEDVQLQSHQSIDFKLTVMTRNMLIAKITVNGVTTHFINTHLESTKDFAQNRMHQFEEIHAFVSNLPKNEAVVVAGDLNMRDEELAGFGGLPPEWIDAWEATGKKKECQFTWDMLRNDNLEMNSKWKPRCRFDRVLLRDSKPSRVIPSSFNLIGIQRLKPHVCFPSDHWGILCVMSTFSSSHA